MPPKKQSINTKANEDERKVLSMLRDIKLKDIRKGGGAGRPMQPSKHIDRTELNKMRDATLKQVRKELGTGRGRPKRAITQYNEKKK